MEHCLRVIVREGREPPLDHICHAALDEIEVDLVSDLDDRLAHVHADRVARAVGKAVQRYVPTTTLAPDGEYGRACYTTNCL